MKTKSKGMSYAKWGYIFLAPFFITFFIFQFWPLATTIYYSFFEYFRSGLKIIGPNFVAEKLCRYDPGGTEILQQYHDHVADGLYPADYCITGAGSMVYRSAVEAAVSGLLQDGHLYAQPYHGIGVRYAVLYPVFKLGNRADQLDPAQARHRGRAGALAFQCLDSARSGWADELPDVVRQYDHHSDGCIMGVDPGLYEAAQLDGASSTTMFWRITIPLIRPLLVYTLITSLIGGLQMFDVPQVLTNGKGDPNGSTNTIIMYLNQHLYSKNYGTAGAISVLMFLLCAVLCVVIYFTLTQEDDGLTREQRKAEKARIKQPKQPLSITKEGA